MPTGDTTTPDPEVTQEVKWFGEEEIFSIGDRPVKIWEVLVGLIILSILLPLLFRGGSRTGASPITSKEGATIVNVRQTGQRKVYQRRKRKTTKKKK